MSECLQLLDQALEIGQRELEFISAGMVEETEEAAHERGSLMERAWNAKDREAVDVDELMDKLKQLKSLQGQLTGKARNLHKALEEDLQSMRREKGRMSGYRKTVAPKPAASRFVSKRG